MTDRQQAPAPSKTERASGYLPYACPQRAIERVGDLIIAGALIAFTLPLMVIIALAIKCESAGPVFYREERIRAGGRRQRLLKFRTTVEHRNPPWPGGQQLSRTGQFLRISRIDELPQLINVLRGELTLAELFSY